jgi:cysteinyl-tRNA synthetase
MLKLHNTLTRKKELFKPLKKGTVSMYNCGLTVYDYATIGNLRAFTFVDLLRRYLEYRKFQVKQVMNFTDVGHMFHDVDIGEDKMEAASKREKKDPWAIAESYIKIFMEDSKKMNLKEPMVRPRATDHIEEMVQLIQKLIEKGYAYIVNGSVYFDVTKFRDYGKLSGNTVHKLKSGAGGRVEFNPEKRNQFDFALWINDPQHIMNWKSPWGENGYPGWHVECSVMAMKYLGETIDIHTGGVDNLFPHHENEIAQSEAVTDKEFARYWLHNEHLLVEGGRMGKSLGNYYTLGDIIEKGYTPRALRYLLISTHYRQQLNFTFDGLKAAENAVDRLTNFIHRLSDVDGKDGGDRITKAIGDVQKRFEEAMDDDLNISIALAALFDFVRDMNKLIDEKLVNKLEAEKIRQTILGFDKVLGVIGEPESTRKKLREEAEKLIQQREKARKRKNYEEADELRKKLREMGVIIEDTPEGVKWRVEET